MKKKFLLTLLTLVLSFTLLLYFPVQQASALPCGFYDYSCRYMINGVGSWGAHNRFYWMNYTASTSCGDLVDKAVKTWNFSQDSDCHTSISLLKTTVQDNAMFEVWLNDYQSTLGGSPGATEYYISGGVLLNNGGYPTQNWVWTKIKLNYPVFRLESNTEKQATIAHEFGHAMGLAHCMDETGYVYDTDRIMCPSDQGRSVYYPKELDLLAINHLYP